MRGPGVVRYENCLLSFFLKKIGRKIDKWKERGKRKEKSSPAFVDAAVVAERGASAGVTHGVAACAVGGDREA